MINSVKLLSEATTEERALFLKKTYTHLALGVLAFVGVESILLRSEAIVDFMMSMTQGYLWLILLGGFMAVTYFAENMAINSVAKSKQYLGYAIYIIAQAFIFVPLIYIAIASTGSYDLINQAAIVTAGLFVGLTLVVFSTTASFSFLRSILSIGFLVALGTIVAGMIFGFNLGLWFSAAMVVLASGSILYNTYNVKNNYHTEQYVAAALSLFASLMLLFWYVLRILMSRN